MNCGRVKWAIVVVALLLGGCKVELYRGLPEGEANQMLALLMLKQISADKQTEKGGSVALRVEKDQFINAVEVLRQNGFPRSQRLGIGDLFPSNQLVTSPTQERAKMVYLKEQQLETMLASIDGVILANVSIGQRMDENGKPIADPSAAVLIKYSPEFNLANNEVQIKSLVSDSVPDIKPEAISVVMQPASYRYVDVRPATASAPPRWRRWFDANQNVAMAGLASAVLALLSGIGVVAWSGRRR